MKKQTISVSDRTVEDENMDNSIDSMRDYIDTVTIQLGKINPSLKVLDEVSNKTGNYIDLVLPVLSMLHEEDIKFMFANDDRITIGSKKIDHNAVNDYTELAQHVSRLPVRTTTVVVRIKALKKLPRPLILTLCYKTFLIVCFVMILSTMIQIIM